MSPKPSCIPLDTRREPVMLSCSTPRAARVRTVSESLRDVGAPTQDDLVYVHHFGVAEPLLQKIIDCTGSRFRTHTDFFYDTPDGDLMKRNVWLRRRSDVDVEWSLKHSVDSADHSGTLDFAELTDVVQVENFLRNKVGLPAGTRDTCVVASIKFHRFRTLRTTSVGVFSVWVDFTKIRNKYYAIGGCSYSSAPSLAILRGLLAAHEGYIPGVSSKVVQFLQDKRPHLYEALQKDNILPQAACSSHALEKLPEIVSSLVTSRPAAGKDEEKLAALKVRYSNVKPPAKCNTTDQLLNFYMSLAVHDCDYEDSDEDGQ